MFLSNEKIHVNKTKNSGWLLQCDNEDIVNFTLQLQKCMLHVQFHRWHQPGARCEIYIAYTEAVTTSRIFLLDYWNVRKASCRGCLRRVSPWLVGLMSELAVTKPCTSKTSLVSFFLKFFYKNPCIVVSCFHQNCNECTHNKMDNNKLLLECLLKDQSVWRLVQQRQSFGIEMIKHGLQIYV